MTQLQEINEALGSTLKELEEKIPLLAEAEGKYYSKYNRYILSSQLKTAADRESETKVQLEDQGFTEPYNQLRTAVKILITRKEILIEMGRNVRNIKMDNTLPF